ncbi:unnamed protein product [Spirodela intermedia]|uniref:Uncharacterized protein n=1 Tax=Spirodela intermedia TaxID=51605 RepID=A0A7I8JNU2_SPIIN|nr:unnamed protein product [Spirodela intermedia]CAA6671844.1 unnamed protein product [Spirodela intermedia]
MRGGSGDGSSGGGSDASPRDIRAVVPYGSSPERVAAYFAEAIHARIVSSHIGVYSSLSAASSTASLPFCRKLMVVQNQKIAQAFQESVHVIDLDIMQGLQWPGLFHILASRHGHKIRSIRITGVGSSLELLDATGRRLSDFAAALGLAFEFHPLEVKIGHITDPSVFHWQPPDSRREVTVVNWMHHCLYDVTGSDLGAVRLLQALRPKLVVIVEQDLTHSGGFLQRFVEALHYYSAMFDALGEAAAAAAASGEEERFQVERQLLGTEIRNIVAVGGPKRTGEVKIERWSEKLERAGFRMMNLAGGPAAAQAGLLLGMLPCKGTP